MIEKLKNNWIVPALAALIFWGFWAFLPKIAMQTMSPQSVIFYEIIGDLIVAIPLLFLVKGKLVRNKKAISITALAGLINIFAILAYYKALQLGPVATVVTMASMYPVVALILAWAVLKEKINKMQCVAIAMAMVAIYLLAS